jgi:hypothetical protein
MPVPYTGDHTLRYDRSMATVSERRLRERLERVEALHRAATTPGEQEAARRAGHRLLQRLEKLRADDPTVQFVRSHLADLGVAPPPPKPPAKLPTERAVLGALARWESGDWPGERLHRWAARVVDRVTLPDDPSHEGACRAEVLLQLAALHHVDLRPSDVPAIRRFLRVRDWTAWFDLVATAAAR